MSGRLILVRHGQSHGNVARRLDTAPPGADLTDLGREQARVFARGRDRSPGLLLHSIARRAAQTAAEIGAELSSAPTEIAGVHEVQAGELEGRDDDEAIAEFNSVYQRWHRGDLAVAMPGGESGHDVLDRYLPVLADLRTRYLEAPGWERDVVLVSHGAAIRLTAARLARVDSTFALENHLANAEAVVLVPGGASEWNCVQWGSLTAPFHAVAGGDPAPDALAAADPMG